MGKLTLTLRSLFRWAKFVVLVLIFFAMMGGWWHISPQYCWSLPNDLFRIGFTADGRNVVFTAGMVDKSKGPDGGPLHAVDIQTGKIVFTTPFPNTRENRDESWLRFDGKNTTVTIDFGKQIIQVCDLAARQLIHEFPFPASLTSRIRGCRFSANDSELLIFTDDNRWFALDLTDGTTKLLFKTGDADNVWCEDGKHVLIASEDRHEIEVWNIAKGAMLWKGNLGEKIFVDELRSDVDGSFVVVSSQQPGAQSRARISAYLLSTGEKVWELVPSAKVEFEEDFSDRFFTTTKVRRLPEQFHGHAAVVVPDWVAASSVEFQTRGLWIAAGKQQKNLIALPIRDEWKKFGTYIRPRSTNPHYLLLETSRLGPPNMSALLPDWLRRAFARVHELMKGDTVQHTIILCDPQDPGSASELTQTVRVAGEPLLSADARWLLTSTIEAKETGYQIYAFPFRSGWESRLGLAIVATLALQLLLKYRRRRSSSNVIPDATSP